MSAENNRTILITSLKCNTTCTYGNMTDEARDVIRLASMTNMVQYKYMKQFWTPASTGIGTLMDDTVYRLSEDYSDDFETEIY